MMRIVFIGDVVGQAGREALFKYLTPIRQTLKPDVVIVNGENAAHGVGITPKICDEFFAAGVDVITLGNHAYKKREILPYLDEIHRVVRPANYPQGSPGVGMYEHTLKDGRTIAVINMLGRVFLEQLDDPFALIDKILTEIKSKVVFIDFHAEATSEKQAFAYWVDGRASAVVGTHTHVPTADTRILAKGTAYMSDAGMTGDYNSIIGSKHEAPIQGFTQGERTLRMEPAEGQATLAGVAIDVDDKTGRAVAIEPIRLGPILKETPLDTLFA